MATSEIAHVITQAVQDGGTATSEIGHVIVQVLSKSVATAEIGHVIVQVVSGHATPTVPGLDLSGIYTIDPNKTPRHDSYYGGNEKKIPDPTIKTALIGE